MTESIQEQVKRLLSQAPAWDKSIPPQAIQIVHGSEKDSGMTSSGPEWNAEWLIGLEQFVRAIVLDEIDKHPSINRGFYCDK